VAEYMSSKNYYKITSLYKIGDRVFHENCGFWKWPDNGGKMESTNCALSVEMILQRKDFQGISLKVAYDDWEPYCSLDPKSGIVSGGIFYEIMEELKVSLNFTTK
jgi:hypothetical protein